jgi:Prealbumin-like fold domain
MATRILGPTGSRRRRRALLVSLLLVTCTALLLVGGATATGGIIVLNSPSNFESGDGDMTLGASGNTDWNCFQGTDGFKTLQSGTPAGCAVTSGAVATAADPNGEVQWVNGQKFDTQCPLLNTGSNPPKDEFTNIAQFLEFAPTGSPFPGDLFFYGGAERNSNNGNASGDVEFNQLTATVPGCPASDGVSSAGARTLGDVLVAYDFANGGTQLNFHVLTWITCNSSTLACGTAGGNVGTCLTKTQSPPCWGANVIVPIAGTAFNGEGNQSPIAAADNAIGGDAMGVNQFAEFGVNLTLALTGKHASEGGQLPCFPQQVWESRSSASSFTSNPQDIEFQHTSTCGNITIIKNTLNGAGTRSGVNQNFSYTSTGGLSPSSFTLNDATGSDVKCPPVAPATTCNKQVYANQSVGAYTVTEGANPTNFTFVSLTCKNNGVTDPNAVSGKVATINLAPGDDWVCTYVNQQQLGAIKITKNSTKAGAAALPGGKFQICTNNGPYTVANPCAAPTGVTNPVTTGNDGTVCVGSLAFADYFVTETQAPTGYKIDDTTTHTVTVDNNASCSDATFVGESFSANDTPLSKIYLGWHSLAGIGVTTATIQCTGEASASTFTDGGAPPAITKTLGDGSSTLTPGSYQCTVIIDP